MNDDAQTRAYAFLKEHDLAVIATVSEKGDPLASAVYYWLDEDYSFYFLTKSKTRKFQNIEDTGKLAVVVSDEAKLTTVQGEGKAEVVKDPSTQAEIMNHLATIKSTQDKAWFPPIAQIEAGSFVVVKCKVDHLQLSEFNHGKPSVNEVVS